MRGKIPELRWQSSEPLRSVSWHHEGKHFVTSHTDGSLCTWPLKIALKPQLHTFPHGKLFYYYCSSHLCIYVYIIAISI